MVDNSVKIATMEIFDNNIKNAKRYGQEAKISNICRAIMKDDEVKRYYQASQHLFEELEKGKSSENN